MLFAKYLIQIQYVLSCVEKVIKKLQQKSLYFLSQFTYELNSRMLSNFTLSGSINNT